MLDGYPWGKQTGPDNCKGEMTKRWNSVNGVIDRKLTDILRITLHCVFYEYADAGFGMTGRYLSRHATCSYNAKWLYTTAMAD